MPPFAWASLVPQTFGEIFVFFGVLVMGYALLSGKKRRKSSAAIRRRVTNDTDESFRKRFEDAPLPPGPRPWPILGNVMSLGEAPHLSFDAMTKDFGPIFRIKIGTVPVIVLNNMKVIKEALNRQREVFSGRPHFASYKLVSLGLGAVFNDSVTMGKSWKELKTKMVKHIHTYAASVDNRESVSKQVWDETVYMTKTLEQMCAESKSGFVDPEQVIRVSVGNAVCAMCFGRRYEVDNAQFVQLLSMNREFGVVISAGSRIDVMPWIKIFPYYKRAADEFEALCLRMENWVLDKVIKNTETYRPGVMRNLIDSLTKSELEISQKRRQTSNANNSLENSDKEKELTVKEQVDYRILSAIVNDIFGAGQDTLSSAYLFILHYMIRFPEVQNRLRQDLFKVVGTDRLPTLADRAKMPYMEAVFHEIMRHSSFVAITIPHLTLCDTILCGYKVPKDTMVFVNQYSANRDATVWKDPYDFNPERFLEYDPDGSCRLDPIRVNKYTIFSTGGRKCPGDELSKFWMIQSMALILHQCEILPDPDNPPTDAICYGLTMKPRNLRIRLRRLDTSVVK